MGQQEMGLVALGSEAGGRMSLGLHLTHSISSSSGMPGTEEFPRTWDFQC